MGRKKKKNTRPVDHDRLSRITRDVICRHLEALQQRPARRADETLEEYVSRLREDSEGLLTDAQSEFCRKLLKDLHEMQRSITAREGRGGMRTKGDKELESELGKIQEIREVG